MLVSMAEAEPRRSVRLRDLRPEVVALEAARALLADMHEKLTALAPAFQLAGSHEQLDQTPIYARVLELANYALHGTPCDVDSTLDYLTDPLFGSACRDGRIPYDPEPSDGLMAVILAAQARVELAHRRPLSSPEVALLLGLDRDYVNRLAMDGAIPGAVRDKKAPRMPWKFSGAAFRAWLAERGVVAEPYTF